MLNFETAVRLNANASPSEISERLTGLVAAPFSFSKHQRHKLLRGQVSKKGGFLRWPLNEAARTSPRNLKFDLLESDGVAVLVGRFVIWQPLRFAVLLWLACGVAFWTWALVKDLHYRPELNLIAKDLGIMVLGCCMAFGYVAFTVFVGRKRDRALIRVLRTVLASEAGANVLKALFVHLTEGDRIFVDPLP